MADVDRAVQHAVWGFVGGRERDRTVRELLTAAVHHWPAAADGVLRVQLVHAGTGRYLFEVRGDGSARVFLRRGPVTVFPAAAFPAPVSADPAEKVRADIVRGRRGGRGALAGAPTGGSGVPGCVGCGAELAWGVVSCAGCGFPVPVLVAAHPGAGVSVLAKATGFRDSSAPADALLADGAPVVLVARMHARGLDTARRLLGEHREDARFAVLLLVPDAPGKLPKPLADQVGVIAAAFPVLRVPWVEAWRWSPGAPTETFTRFFPTLVAALRPASSES